MVQQQQRRRGGDNPFLLGRHPTAEQLDQWTKVYTVLDLHELGKHFLPDGKLPCPRCKSGKHVLSKGPAYDSSTKCFRTRRIHNIGTEDYVLSYKYQCTDCPGARRGVVRRARARGRAVTARR